MSVVQAILLGILQGLTEFLPVSSSGHLVIAQSLMPGFTQPGVLFDVMLHTGTLMAVIVYFRKTLSNFNRKYLELVIIGSLPALVAGLIFQDLFESLFSATIVVGIALLITGSLNYATDKSRKKKEDFNYLDSLLVGFAQAVAIIPGISRSGSTIFTATKLGIDRKKAAEFSFILSLPAVFGASVLQFAKYYSIANSNTLAYLAGFIAAAITGYFAISIVVKTLLSKKFIYFAFYCGTVGLFALLI